jgi:alanine-glyoxylate transaminase / (R)-3-amino-2-methylpropionate-pyruvate transaminase
MSLTEKRSDMPPCEHKPSAYTGPSRDEVIELRRQYVSPGVFTYYRTPIQIVEGFMQYLWDDTGRRYLDAIGGVVTVSVGHCHPRIVEAARKQVGMLAHTTTIYLNPNIATYAKRLSEHFPPESGLEVSYFTNSGSEANDLAATMARLHTGQFDIISLRNGYHGGTGTTMGLTAMGNWKFPLPHSFGIKHATPGYCYRCPYGLEYSSCDVKCARDVAQLIDYETSGTIAAFIAEPIQGAGGVIDPPPEYFKIVFDIVRAHGGLCISDEVQTGFGRLGSHFWGFDAYGVTPDIVTMAKGIANGAPLGAVTTRREIAECLKQKLHFNTFGGNPVSMIQAQTTLEIIDDEKVMQRAHDVGGYLKERLCELQRNHSLIGDVRGRGLLLGVELVRDRKTKEPATQEAMEIHEGAKERGVLIGRGGVYGNVLRIKPPMCITREDVDFLVDALDETIASP